MQRDYLMTHRGKTGVLVMALMACVRSLRAAEQAVIAPAEAMTLRDILVTGGWPMIVLGAMSVLGVTLIVFYLLTLRASQLMPRDLRFDLREMLSAGRLDEARRACQKSTAALGSVVLSGLEYLQTATKPDQDVFKEIMEAEGSRQATRIQNQTQYLLDIAVIAPMVGLLGTVIGMLRAFNSVAQDIARTTPQALTEGVAQALITTAAGLVVGIPAMMFYAYFRARSSRLIAGLEISAAEAMSLSMAHVQERHEADAS